jgi:hypothetical protein
MIAPLAVIVKSQQYVSSRNLTARRHNFRRFAAWLRPPWTGRRRRGRRESPACPACRGRSVGWARQWSGLPPHGQIRREIGPHATGGDPTIAQRVLPCQSSSGKQHKSCRIRLDHVGRRAAGVSRTSDALNRAIRRNSHLDRTAGCPLAKRCEQHTDGVAQCPPIDLEPGVEGRDGEGHSVGIGATGGHDRTIRPVRRTQTGAPGSRKALRTRHSCLRCIPLWGCVVFSSKGAWA